MSTSAVARKLAVTDAYEIWSESYDTDPNPLLALEERYFLASMEKFRGKDIVELGCGTGRWLKLLEDIRPRSLMGVDLSLPMLEKARMKCAATTRYLVADCTRTFLPDSCADCVLSAFVLAHVSNIQAFADEASRVVRKSGAILISDLHPQTTSYGWRQTFRAAGSCIEVESRTYDFDELVTAFHGAGCVLEKLVEPGFGIEERRFFEMTGTVKEFCKVQGLPVIYRAYFKKL